MPMEKVTFEPNTPVCVRLKYPVGKIVSGNYGEQVYYSTADGKAMYLDLAVGEKVNRIAAKPGEPIMIMKRWTGKKTDRAEWLVWKDDGSDPELVGQLAQSVHLAGARRVGEQPDGTFAVPKAPGAGASTPAPAKPITNGNGASHPHATNPRQQPADNPDFHESWAQSLLAEANALVDVYAAAWAYAREKYSGQVRPDDVRGLVTTAYINSRKNGGAR